MIDRRTFLRTAAAAGCSVAMARPLAPGAKLPAFPEVRPAPERRRFRSEAVEATVREVRAACSPELGWLFGNCFPNTLDTTVTFQEKDGRPDTFVITGDIDAMWLRDSSAQVFPYVSLAAKDPALRRLLAGVIRRQADCIRIDPYANAFNAGPTGSDWDSDHTDMKPELHERKWEVDSLCWPIRLAHAYWRATGDTVPFDGLWREAMVRVLRTFREQQRKEGPGPYRFTRNTEVPTDTLAGGGYGNPIRPCGLIVSSFRPSDDATTFSFLISSNHFAVAALGWLAELADGPARDPDLARSARSLREEVAKALQAHGTAVHPVHGRIWAFEVDGMGNANFMDDANVPSLLALPYLGCCAPDDPLYLATRRFLLSPENPWFCRGRAAEGIGGPHAGPDTIWPMSLVTRAFTSTREPEIRACLRTLVATHAGTGYLHESFHKDDPTRFTRPWFAWANTYFGELVLHLYRTRPALLA
jgi:uncharacterized protein